MGPETGGQAPQEFQHCGLQRLATIETLHHHQPQNHQRRVERVIALDTSLLLDLLQELENQKALKKRKDPF
jgi:hypothetical protein